jgi:hypothetical protein
LDAHHHLRRRRRHLLPSPALFGLPCNLHRSTGLRSAMLEKVSNWCCSTHLSSFSTHCAHQTDFY